MSNESTVLIVTQPFDVTADGVVDELNRRGVPVFRCDPGDFPRGGGGQILVVSVDHAADPFFLEEFEP